MQMVKELKTRMVLKDEYSSQARKIGDSAQSMAKSLGRVKQTAEKTYGILKKLSRQKYAIKITAIQDRETSQKIRTLDKKVKELTNKKHSISIFYKESNRERLSRLGKIPKDLLAKTTQAKVSIIGTVKALNETRKVNKELKKIGGERVKLNIDMPRIAHAGGIMKDKLKSGAGMLALGAKNLAKGLGGLLFAGLGVAKTGITEMAKEGSELEGYNTSMLHWTGGDEKKRDSYMAGLRKEANATPFSTSDVVQAGERALSITNGDTQKGLELVKQAEDMAALTGKKPIDAMEALADAQMGEMERLKEFGFNASKKDLDAVGGDISKLKNVQGQTMAEAFSGGAKKLSQTSSGMMSIAKGNIQSGIADAGLKLLEAARPVLEGLIPITEAFAAEFPEVVGNALNGLMNLIGGTEGVKKGFDAVKSAVEFATPILKSVFESTKTVFLEGILPVVRSLTPILKVIARIVGDVLVTSFNIIAQVAEKVGSALSSIIDAIASLPFFGGGSSKTDKIESTAVATTSPIANSGATLNVGAVQQIGKKTHAGGTMYYTDRGGTINELGDEMLQDRRGMRIFPAEKTNKILSKEAKNLYRDRRNIITVNIDARGSNMSIAEQEAMENRVVQKMERVLRNIPA